MLNESYPTKQITIFDVINLSIKTEWILSLGDSSVGRGDFEKFSQIFLGINMNTCVTITRTIAIIICLVIEG